MQTGPWHRIERLASTLLDRDRLHTPAVYPAFIVFVSFLTARGTENTKEPKPRPWPWYLGVETESQKIPKICSSAVRIRRADIRVKYFLF